MKVLEVVKVSLRPDWLVTANDRVGGSDGGPPGVRDYHSLYDAAFLGIPTAIGSRHPA